MSQEGGWIKGPDQLLMRWMSGNNSISCCCSLPRWPSHMLSTRRLQFNHSIALVLYWLSSDCGTQIGPPQIHRERQITCIAF